MFRQLAASVLAIASITAGVLISTPAQVDRDSLPECTTPGQRMCAIYGDIDGHNRYIFADHVEIEIPR